MNSVRRFPPTFGKFQADDYEDRKELNHDQKQEVANYDNATLYNDSIVYEIIKMYKDDNAIVIYFADHGDEANDYRVHIGRSRNLDVIGAPGLHTQLDVPFLIYVSDLFKQNYPAIVNEISNAIHLPFITDDLPHLLLELAQIDVEYFNPKRSLINKNFNVNRKRVIQALTSLPVDYDSVCAKYGPWKIGF